MLPIKQLSKTFSCPLCGKGLDRMYRVKAYIGNFQLSIRECLNCELAIQIPRPSIQEQRDYMNWRYSSTDPLDGYITDVASKLEICRHRLKWISTFKRPNNRLLDIGAGNGAFCSSAVQFGYQVCGTELCAKAVSQARKLFGLNLFFGDIKSLPNHPLYGLVTLWDVIEHLRDPLVMLQEAFARMTQHGLIVIHTGNYSSQNRLEQGSSWPLYLFDHLFYFSPKSIEILVRRAGFSDFQIHRLPPLESTIMRAIIKRKAMRMLLNPVNGLQWVRKRVITEFRKKRCIHNESDFWDFDELLVTARKA